MPSSRQARTMRRAISPRLAMRIFWIIEIGKMTKPPTFAFDANYLKSASWRRSAVSVDSSADFDFVEALAVFDRLAVFNEDFEDAAFGFRLNLVHDLHGLNDADDRLLLELCADFDEGRAFRRG